MNNSWIKETMELVEELQKQHAQIEARLASLHDEKQNIENQIAVADELIRMYRNKHEVLPMPLQDIHKGYFGDKSYRDILIEIASKLGGYFKVTDATDIMLRAGVSDNRRTIQANIYAVLRRDKRHFTKIKEGEYRYTNGSSKTIVVSAEHSSRSRSGVQEAIKKLKENNPQMTKTEVLKHLLRIGFDFKGKKPTSAVNIVWAKLGYSKEGKQQSLPGVS